MPIGFDGKRAKQLPCAIRTLKPEGCEPTLSVDESRANLINKPRRLRVAFSLLDDLSMHIEPNFESISINDLDDVTGGNALKWAKDTVRAGGVALGLLTHEPAVAGKAIGVTTQQVQKVERAANPDLIRRPAVTQEPPK